MNYLKIGKSITNRDDEVLKAYLKDISKYKLLTPEEEYDTALKASTGDKNAINKLVTSNLRFVVSIAKQYQGQSLSLSDLISEGSLGMIKAAEKFDPTKGIKFISYAVWWIRQSIMLAISEQSRTVRLPVTQVSKLIKFNKISSKFEQENERVPSSAELSEILDIPEEKIIQTMNYSKNCVSMDTPFDESEEDSSTLIEVIPNGDKPIDIKLMEESVSKEIQIMLNSLCIRDRDIIKMFYGFGMNPQSHEEIGQKFGITGERVRQLKESALKTLRLKYNSNLEKY